MIFSYLLNMQSHPSWVCGLKPYTTDLYHVVWKSHPSWVCGLKLYKHVKETQWYIVGEPERPMILNNTETKDDKDGRYTTFTFKRTSVDLPCLYAEDPLGVTAVEAAVRSDTSAGAKPVVSGSSTGK